jgi:hypothetical protein
MNLAIIIFVGLFFWEGVVSATSSEKGGDSENIMKDAKFQKFTFKSGNTYEGFMKLFEDSLLMHGPGKLNFVNGDKYVGMFKRNLYHGTGRFDIAGGGYYEGLWHNDKKHGEGDNLLEMKNGDVYSGGFKDDKFNGFGLLKMKSPANSYIGFWAKGLMHGQGEYTFEDGTLYTGSFENNKIQGEGKAVYPNGIVEEGVYIDNKLDVSDEIPERLVDEERLANGLKKLKAGNDPDL